MNRRPKSRPGYLCWWGEEKRKRAGDSGLLDVLIREGVGVHGGDRPVLAGSVLAPNLELAYP